MTDVRVFAVWLSQLMDLSRAPGIVEDPVDKGMKWLRLRVDSEGELAGPARWMLAHSKIL